MVDDFDGDIFIYRGGRAPQHITHVLIDKSVDEIEDNAFRLCVRLVQVDIHDGLRKIGRHAFLGCRSLRRIILKSAVEIEEWAFGNCVNLVNVEFGDRLETIGKYAFNECISLQHLKLPSIVIIGASAFCRCESLLDAELSERLETLGVRAFSSCRSLQRIAIPMKRDLFYEDDDIFNWERYSTQFLNCEELITVDLVGGIHETVASLHMESWRAEMLAEINRINHVLPNTPVPRQTYEIEQWMDSVLDKMDRCRAEHCRYVKEGITLLELALWKAKLGEKDNKDDSPVERQRKKAKVDSEVARKEKRITCGADMVIKNVLPFLKLE